jgi:hypothetical protein
MHYNSSPRIGQSGSAAALLPLSFGFLQILWGSRWSLSGRIDGGFLKQSKSTGLLIFMKPKDASVTEESR